MAHGLSGALTAPEVIRFVLVVTRPAWVALVISARRAAGALVCAGRSGFGGFR
jgi:hypothetical protein